VHAAGESAPGDLPSGTYAVALAAESEAELRRLADQLEAAGEPVVRIVEQHGRYAGQPMALGIRPGPKSQRGRLLSSLPLLRLDQFCGETSRLHRNCIMLRTSLWRTLLAAWCRWWAQTAKE